MQRIYVLTARGNPSPQLRPAAGSDEWMTGGGPGTMIGTARTMQEIAESLEGQIQAPVVDETGLKGKYNYSASSKLSGLEAGLDPGRPTWAGTYIRGKADRNACCPEG